MSLVIPGDLHLEPQHRRRLGRVVNTIEECDSTDDHAVRACLRQAKYLFALNVWLNPFMHELAKLDLTVVDETGIVHLDPEEARRAGVRFTNIPDYATEAVVQYVVRCILESLRPWDVIFSPVSGAARKGAAGTGLESLSVGLIGFGHIGRRLAETLHVLGARLMANTRGPFHSEHVLWVSSEELFGSADIVVVCCERDQDSTGMIGSRLMRRLPRNSILISISHRDVFDYPDLASLLSERNDIRAWLDFDLLEIEEPLAKLPNVKLSPHLAFLTRSSLVRRVDKCVERLEAYVSGGDWALE